MPRPHRSRMWPARCRHSRSRRRGHGALTSTVGADQMPAPDGPHSGTPVALVPRRCGDSRDHVGLPLDRARLGIERGQRFRETCSTDTADRRPVPLHMRHRHVQPALEERRRPGDPRRRVIVNPPHPQRASRSPHRARTRWPPCPPKYTTRREPPAGATAMQCGRRPTR